MFMYMDKESQKIYIGRIIEHKEFMLNLSNSKIEQSRKNLMEVLEGNNEMEMKDFVPAYSQELVDALKEKERLTEEIRVLEDIKNL